MACIYYYHYVVACLFDTDIWLEITDKKMMNNTAAGLTPVIFSNYSPQVMCFHKSMRDRGLPCGFICVKTKGEIIPKSNYVKNICFIDQRDISTPEGAILIQNYLKTFTSWGLVAINEKIALWLWENISMPNQNCRMLLPDKQTLERVLSKTNQAAAARQAGLKVLPTWLITKHNNANKNIPEHHFPVCIRPSGPGAVVPSFKVDVIPNSQALVAFINNTSAIDKYIIAQPFMNLPNLVVHGSRAKEGKTIGLQGFMVDRKFEGLTLTIKPFDLSKKVEAQCIKFTDLMGIQGPYHFEFLFDEKTGDAWFLEVNNRLGGTTAKVFALGYDEPGYLLQSFGCDINAFQKIEDKSASSRIALLKYLYFTLNNQITPLDYPAKESKATRILNTIKAFIFNKDDILSLKDCKGALSFYFAGIRQKFI